MYHTQHVSYSMCQHFHAHAPCTRCWGLVRCSCSLAQLPSVGHMRLLYQFTDWPPLQRPGDALEAACWATCCDGGVCPCHPSNQRTRRTHWAWPPAHHGLLPPGGHAPQPARMGGAMVDGAPAGCGAGAGYLDAVAVVTRRGGDCRCRGERHADARGCQQG